MMCSMWCFSRSIRARHLLLQFHYLRWCTAAPFLHQRPSSALGSIGEWELSVHWVGRDASDCTWEKLDDFKEAYPEFQLEDELFRKEGGSVADAFVGITYRRTRRKDSPTSSSG